MESQFMNVAVLVGLGVNIAVVAFGYGSLWSTVKQLRSEVSDLKELFTRIGHIETRVTVLEKAK